MFYRRFIKYFIKYKINYKNILFQYVCGVSFYNKRSKGSQNKMTKWIYGGVFFNTSTHSDFFENSECGGGEVSGGGTHYM